jgi:NADH-quinone oxidoreductase subunit K
MFSTLPLFLLAALLLMALGLLGLISRRTLVGMLISVELLLNGAGLSVVAATQLTPAAATAAAGQLAAVFIMGLAAAEATLILAMMVVVYRRFGSVETDALTTLKDADL